MGKATGIGWTDRTWNPWYGCERVSEGCDNCYMFRDMRFRGLDPAVVQRSKSRFRDPLKWKEPARVFTCSWGDWFHKDADAWRPEAWEIVKATPHLTYQILTKRPSRIHRHLPPDWGPGYPNVWLGVSAEHQQALEQRVPLLWAAPAVVRYVSAEPLLGPLNLPYLNKGAPFFNWLIAGGESGWPPHVRPADLAWFRWLRDQCADDGIAFFLKQLGGPPGQARSHELAVLDGRTHTEFPS